MSPFDMSDSVAIVTGSTKGIGRAIAERLCEQGAKAVVSSRKRMSAKQSPRISTRTSLRTVAVVSFLAMLAMTTGSSTWSTPRSISGER